MLWETGSQALKSKESRRFVDIFVDENICKISDTASRNIEVDKLVEQHRDERGKNTVSSLRRSKTNLENTEGTLRVPQ